MSDKKLSTSDFKPAIERQRQQPQQQQPKLYSISYDPHASTPTRAIFNDAGARRER